METSLKDCGRCNGTGNLVVATTVPFREDGEYALTKHTWGKSVVLPINVTEKSTCNTCKGHGHISKRQHQAWKSETMAKRYAGTKAAQKCYICHGAKFTVELDMFHECHTCSGSGKIPVWTENTDINNLFLSEVIDPFDHFDKDFATEYFSRLSFMVVRAEEAVTWNEYNLGVGVVYSSTDYGDAWKMNDEDLKESIAQKLIASPGQMINFVAKDTREFASVAIIKVKPQGYTVNTAMTLGKNRKAGLPPTYTDDLLDQKLF